MICTNLGHEKREVLSSLSLIKTSVQIETNINLFI